VAKPLCAGLIPAAGLGRRAGKPKAELILADDPNPLLLRCAAGLRAAGADQVFVVIREAHRALAEEAGVFAVVPNPAPETMIESVLAGLNQIEQIMPQADGLLLCPVDAARAAEAAAEWLSLAWQADPGSALIPGYRSQTGHPAWLPRNLWDQLRSPGCLELGAQSAFAQARVWECGDEAVLDNVNELF